MNKETQNEIQEDDNASMPPNRRMKDSENQVENFHLPDMCKVQPLFFLILTAQLLVLAQSLSVSSLSAFDWLHLATMTFYVQWNVLLCAAVLCMAREYIQTLSRNNGAMLAWLLILLVSLVLGIVAQWFTYNMAGGLAVKWQPSYQQVLRYLLIAAIMGGIALRYLYLQQQAQVLQQSRLHAHIQALQSRIRPHFLFNSMNIVASLIATDPERAERVVEDISELFRASLRAGNDLVTLKEEIALCKRYVAIEQLRLGDRLKVVWNINESLDHVLLPSLTLQPLVENAVYHGIQPLAKGGVVDIDANLNDGFFSLVIGNPLASKEVVEQAGRSRGNRLALNNTIARLQAHFGPEANVKTIMAQNRFSAEISYSVKK